MRTLIVVFAATALAALGAETYRINLYQDCVIGGTEVKPGEYKLEVNGGSAAFLLGKTTVAETPVKVETTTNKFASTSVRYDNGDGKYRVQEIRLGGTNTKLMFN